MGSVFPENTGAFEISTNASGKTEILVPLTPAYFESVLATDFQVPEIRLPDGPTLSPQAALSSSLSSYASDTPSVLSSELSSDVPSYVSLQFPSPSITNVPNFLSVLPTLRVDRNDGPDDVPTVTTDAPDSSSTNPLRGRMTLKWLVALAGLAIDL